MKSVRTPVQPAWLMSLYWLFLYFIYLVAPIHQTPQLTWPGLLFELTHIAFYVIGATWCARASLRIARSRDYGMVAGYYRQAGSSREYGAVRLVLMIGILGGLLSAYAKLSLVGEYSLAALASLRTERAQEVLYADQVKSSIASVLAFFFYPAGFVGLVATLLRYETVSANTRMLAGLYVVVVFLLTIIAGGRSPVMVLLLFTAITFYLRKCLGLSTVPASGSLRFGMSFLLLVFIAYSSLVWAIRSHASGLDLEAFMRHAETVWGVRPSDWLLSVASWTGKPEIVQTIMSSIFYFTQNLSITERVLDARYDIVPMLGGYQVDLVAALLRSFPTSAEFLAAGNQVLLDANVYGFFTGAWASLFVDFGYFSLLMVLLWGYLSGRAYRNLVRKGGLVNETRYIFWTYAVFISFVSPPFGFSNSFITFVWFVIFGLAASIRIGVRTRLVEKTV